uniref:Vacuolar ATPase assembly protein VMA22 n=1 Tax=Corvus moneduloides TaxID=1196302 RepID=A0A8U7NV01_CORMO
PPPGSLSLSLDAAALEVMEALELLQQRREQLEEHLRQGWLSLAQARYSLGCHRVSSLQYGATMVPRVRVCRRWGTEGDEDTWFWGGSLTFLCPPGLRQRGAPARPPPDPLGWFGVLVPPSLRQAQGSFQKGENWGKLGATGEVQTPQPPAGDPEPHTSTPPPDVPNKSTPPSRGSRSSPLPRAGRAT